MKRILEYRFIVGMISIIAGLLAITCLVVGAMAVNYHFEAFSDPVLTLQYAHNLQLVKWFNLLDMFGYYLFLLPLVFYFHQQYRYTSPWSSLISFSGLAYVLIGALGAAILAVVWPALLTDHAAANQGNKMVISQLFKTTTTMVTLGMWNTLEVVFAAVWWLGLGRMLYAEHKTIGLITFILGASSLLDAMGTMLDMTTLAELGLNLYLVLGFSWPVIIGIFLIRKSIKQIPIPGIHD